VNAVDTTAAGDTFTGYFIARLVQHLKTSEMMKMSTMASAIVVSRKEAASSIPSIDEVKKILNVILENCKMTDVYNIVFIFEIIGTIAFAFSGAMIALQNEMDFFGVNVMGVGTAVGGGMIRDLVLGILPPSMFMDYRYVLISIVTSSLIFCIVYNNKKMILYIFELQYNHMIMFLDSIGLGIFTVIGINTAIEASFSDNAFILIFVGTVTGIGGGILRDLMSGSTPIVMKKHIYASASIIGAIIYINIYSFFPKIAAIMIAAAAVVVIRILAVRFNWNLPKIHLQNDDKKQYL